MSGNLKFKRTRKPSTIADALASSIGSYHLRDKLSQYSAFPHWAEIVGPEIARVTIPEKIVARRILVVRVIDASWVQELSLRKPEILARWEEFGQGPILEDVRFVAGNPTQVPDTGK